MSIVSLNINTLSKVSQRTLNHSTQKISKSTEKLSTGKRINVAGDDIASLSIATKIDSELKGLSKAKQNIIDQRGHLDVLYGAFEATFDNIQRIRELFIQGINGTNSVDEKNALQREINEIIEFQDNLARNTKVINGSLDVITTGGGSDTSFPGYINFVQTGANDSEGFTMDYNLTAAL